MRRRERPAFAGSVAIHAIDILRDSTGLGTSCRPQAIFPEENTNAARGAGDDMTNPDDGLRRFEAALGAISKMTGEGQEQGLGDARCPECGASDFVAASDLYS